MTFSLAPLPYALDAFEPTISEKTMRFYYHKHHQGYVDKLNELIRSSSGDLFNMAAQVWNHDFFWKCLSPKKGQVPTGQLAQMIDEKWGDLKSYQAAFSEQAFNHFGSGWTWLVLRNDHLEIIATPNAHNPVIMEAKTLLTIDLWEHAYYLDFHNDKAAVIEAYWDHVNWDFVVQRFMLDPS